MDGNRVNVFSELRHFTGNGLPVLCQAPQSVEYSEKIKGRLESMFERFARADYPYQHTACFNPDVAVYYIHRVSHAFDSGDYASLKADLDELIDLYAVEVGCPNETSAARQAHVRTLFGD